MDIAFILLLLWAVVTLVGHGTWVVLSRILGPRPPEPRRDTRATGPTCPRCRASLQLADSQCSVCGWPGEVGTRTDPQAALRSLRQQLDRLSKLEAVGSETYVALTAVIHSELRRLAERAAAEVPVEQSSDSAASLSVDDEIESVAVKESPPPAAASPAPLAERADKYAASRAAAEKEPLPEPPPPKKREAMSRLFATFMEEKNIRWGELVGGLLIVGSSVALVISFWAEIAAQPLLKFVLLGGVTAALFGVGLYTDRRWKIHTTSHGLLVIASLLVPLNFLAIAAFTQDSPPTDLLSLSGEAVSLAVFAWLVYLAGSIVTPNAAMLLTLGVMLPSLVQLLVRRWAEPATPLAGLYALAAAPIACYVATTTVVVRRCWLKWEQGAADPASAPAATGSASPPGATRSASAPAADSEGEGEETRAKPMAARAIDETDAYRLFTFLGVVTAATLLPLALLVAMLPPLEDTIHRLSPLAVWCGLPGLLAGLLFWRRLTDRRLTGIQTAGISVGVLGAMVMLGAVVAAWPDPATLLPTAAMNIIAFAAVAFWFGIPAALVPAGLAMAGAWLVGFHLIRGNLDWTLPDYQPLAEALLSVASGHALVPLVGLFAALIGLLWRARRPDDARMIALVAAVTALASLALVVWFGFGRVGDPDGARWTLAIYALACLVAVAIVDRVPLAWIVSALLLAALWQGIVFHHAADWAIDRPRVAALLAHATLAVVGLVVLARRRRRHVNLRMVLQWSAVITSFAAVGMLLYQMTATPAGALAVELAWLAGVWLVVAALAGWPVLFTASQLAVVLAIFFAVTAAVETRSWYIDAARPWLDPWFLELQGIALALYCLTLGAVRWAEENDEFPNDECHRIGVRHSSFVIRNSLSATGSRLLSPPWPAVDHILEVALVSLLVLVAGYGVLPGVAQELMPLEAARGAAAAVRVVAPIDEFEIPGIAHEHATGGGAWLLGLAVVAVLTAGLARRRAVQPRLAGFVIALAMICPLLAARWEADVAVASALRWLSAGFFCVASIPIWMRGRSRATGSAAALGATGSASANRRDQALAEPVAPVRNFDSAIAPFARQARDLLVAITCLVYVVIGVYVAQAALARAGMAAGTDWLWPYVLGWALVAAVAAMVIPRAAEGKARDLLGQPTGQRKPWARTTRDVLLLMALAPAVILAAFAVASALDQHLIVGPEPASWFRTIGWDVSYGLPLAVVALVLLGYAIRDRSSGFAFSAGLLANVVATIVVLLRLARGGGGLDADAWITIAQVNAIVAGLVALAWLTVLAVYRRRQEIPGGSRGLDPPYLLMTQVALAAALCGTFILPAAVQLAVEPIGIANWVIQSGQIPGWIALALATAAAAWIQWRRPVSGAWAASVAAGLVAMIALAATHGDVGNWLAYHTLLVGCCAAAWLVPLAARAADRLVPLAPPVPSPTRYWQSQRQKPIAWSAPAVRAFAVIAVFLALRALEGDPSAPWWTIAALAAISARNVWIAWYESRHGFMWIAALFIHVAVSIWWIDSGHKLTGTQNMAQGLEFLWFNTLAAAAMAIISLWTLRHRAGPSQNESIRWYHVSFHRFAAWAIVATLLFTTGLGLLADLLGEPFPAYMPLAWAAWLAAVLAAVACWWDPAARWPVACVYSVGLLGVGLYLDSLDFRAPRFHWALANALAAYSLATSYLWNRRSEIRATLARLGVPTTETNDATAAAEPTRYVGSGHGWLVSANTLSAVAVLLLVAWIEIIMPEFTHRMIAAYAIGAEALALGLLARGLVRTSLQFGALVFGVLFAVAFGCAWLPPDFDAVWLHRTVAASVALAVMIALYGIGLVKLLRRENEWTRAAQRLVPLLAVVAAVLLLIVLGMEVSAFAADGSVPIVWPALIAVVLALIALSVAALAAALLPGRDPLGLSERGRTVYVYAAEALAALTFLHIRVTMPWLFHGWFLQFWPLIVMAIAFVGVGLAEFFHRRRDRVLAEPLATTGVLLPLLPALGFWVHSSQVNYSLLLLSVGALYAAVSVLRQSFLFGVLAAVAANGSLWYLLYTGEGLAITEHPQLWLIPPAICVLVAGYLNRERLSNEQSAALRYGAAIVIYVSSTADIFINGVADAPWLPAVLAALSIAGVFAGILLRVRAFLYLGTAFLVVAMATIIWYAAIEQQRTYILWITGIVTGVLIIALFGLFEKRRDDVLWLVEQLKKWEA